MLDWLALAALLVSSISLYMSLSTDKTQRLQELDAALHDPRSQEGRRLLFHHHAGGAGKEHRGRAAISENQPDVWSSVNHSLAILDRIGYYHSRGWLPRRSRWPTMIEGSGRPVVLELWATHSQGSLNPPVFSWDTEQRSKIGRPKVRRGSGRT